MKPSDASAGPEEQSVRPERIPPGGEGPPIHPLAAVLLITVDNLWNFADWAVVSWVVTVPLGFLSVFFPTLLIQRFLKRDSMGKAFSYALLLGAVAAIPTSVTGTPVGVALLAWTGISKLIGKQQPTNRKS